MTFLLDTHLLLWAAGDPGRLSSKSRELLCDPTVELMFSTASIWEVVVKNTLGRCDFRVDPRELRDGLMQNGYSELVIRSEHALAVDLLPPIHKDPFDRILIAQAQVENVTLLTMDNKVVRYPGPIQAV
ncbi:MAG: type II toxin-antitoxin system VapC family toxin [Gemmatimonadetes bacterium]|nr:type II toxin-antitoxin system VapC family toxin [Gemmatimonadota bacterium]MDE3258301.1 type II toxin-antitoxin system VapC family toxin [Gemmatimonadota bacterium]